VDARSLLLWRRRKQQAKQYERNRVEKSLINFRQEWPLQLIPNLRPPPPVTSISPRAQKCCAVSFGYPFVHHRGTALTLVLPSFFSPIQGRDLGIPRRWSRTRPCGVDGSRRSLRTGLTRSSFATPASPCASREELRKSYRRTATGCPWWISRYVKGRFSPWSPLVFLAPAISARSTSTEVWFGQPSSTSTVTSTRAILASARETKVDLWRGLMTRAPRMKRTGTTKTCVDAWNLA
jgi:hypothetical protein